MSDNWAIANSRTYHVLIQSLFLSISEMSSIINDTSCINYVRMSIQCTSDVCISIIILLQYFVHKEDNNNECYFGNLLIISHAGMNECIVKLT